MTHAAEDERRYKMIFQESLTLLFRSKVTVNFNILYVCDKYNEYLLLNLVVKRHIILLGMAVILRKYHQEMADYKK